MVVETVLFRPRPSELPDSRSDYRAYDLDSPRFDWFHREYDAALEADYSWIHKPEAVGLRLAGYPNPDGVRPDIVRVYWPRPDKAIVVVIATGLMDDSVEAMKVRVDLVQRGHLWEVEWAGGQWRCWPGRGGSIWGSRLCV
ncbi:MAG: hypothetical protein GTN93_19960 [Anaerolineae bacterium]|nr:hypothetical protein [Anaerolineae bacterium]